MEQTFTVPEISCAHCKSAIEGALTPLTGVASAEVDIESKTVAVSYDESSVTEERLVAAIDGVGYTVAGRS